MITTDSYLTYTIQGVEYKIGLSKTLNNYSSADFTDDMYNVGVFDKVHNVGTYNTEFTQPYMSIVGAPLDSANIQSEPGSAVKLYTYHSENEIQMYARTLLCVHGGNNRVQYYKGSSDVKIITELNVQDWFIVSSFDPTGTDEELEEIFMHKNSDLFCTLVNKHDNSVTVNAHILSVVIDKDNLCIYNPFYSSVIGANKSPMEYGSGYSIDYPDFFTPYFDNATRNNINLLYYTVNFKNSLETPSQDVIYEHTQNEKYKFMLGYEGILRPFYEYYYIRYNAIVFRDVLSWSGLYFRYNNIDYKPIIKDGIVVGYTDDFTVKSDIDEWTDINNHNIPVNPPAPTPSDEDEIDDMKLGVGRNYSGMVKYYRLSPAQLLVFSQEIQKESVVPAGYDIMQNIIALKRFPTNLDNYAEFGEAELIKLGSVTVPLSASQLDGEKKNISLGKYTIQGYHGTKENPHFLDFSPYTTAEVFIPYCGFVTIPVDKIMYNEIEVRLLVDVKLGNCTGVIKCNGNIVGQKAGALGADIPLVAVNMGVAMGAITQGLMDTTLGFVSAIPYAAAGNVAATFSGVLNGATALTQTIMSSKKNYTEVIGTTGGDIMFTMPDRCYIKLTYPKKDLPSNYGKMVGYMCGKGGRLGDFSGFTICENVHVNVKATEEEKQMILEKLLTGVIMPYNG